MQNCGTSRSRVFMLTSSSTGSFLATVSTFFARLHGTQDIHGILAEEFAGGEDAGDDQPEEASE